MRLQLTARRAATFGQDFLAARINRRLNVTPLVADAGGAFTLGALSQGPHLIISHNPEDEGEAHLLAGLPPNVRAVVHRHVQWSYLDRRQQENVRTSMARASLCIVPAAFLAAESHGLFPETPCEVVHIGRDPAMYRPADDAERAAFRARLGIAEDRYLILHVGRLEAAKGLQILCDLAARLPESAALLIQFTASADETARRGGFWPQALEIQRARPGRVFPWPDTDPQSDRPVRHADLLLSASLKEVAPMVAVEALMSGAPVAATESTPFYAELHALGVASEDLTVAPLPFAERLAGRTRSELTLTDAETDTAARLLANAIEDKISQHHLVSKERRDARSNQMTRLGFTEDRMVSRLDALYNSVVENT
ncbi:hypothetical protein CCAX7_57830 [Capsulimonas corticalis]|uniref:Uncharacterized protein n=1 Tax=Capsulimonas corticalis TaxID=2219043 RepID=A0A402D0A4_9BACT|nr:hypothetical protein [Capsulimonas corticalis]BDI33732.1 hypothetical protein CCAX7_57830 [Capsulimonas corticalis]